MIRCSFAPKALHNPSAVSWGEVSSADYTQQILDLFGSALFAYWTCREAAGGTATDLKNGLTATIGAGAMPGAATTQRGKQVYWCPSTGPALTGYTTAGFNSRFNGAEGTALVNVHIAGLDWASASTLYVLTLYSDVNSHIYIAKAPGGGVWLEYSAGGVVKGSSLTTGAYTTEWLTLALTWSKSNNRVRGYFQNWQPYPEQTGLGTWDGTLTAANSAIGGFPYVNYHKGGLSDVMFFNRELSGDEIGRIVKILNPTIARLTILGDSKESEWIDWPAQLAPVWKGGGVFLSNHAVAGVGIVNGLAAQATAAAGDNADAIVITLGTNDSNAAGNMAAIQSAITSNVAALKKSNPSAQIFYMNALPRWTDAGGGTPYDLSNVRTAVAAGCAAAGIPCWDTFNTPWIAAGDTSDGLHPTQAGHAKIQAQILARLP